MASVVVLAGLAGCGDDGDADASPGSTTTATTEGSTTTTTTAETTTTPTTAPAIEGPDNTGPDMVAVLQSLSDFGNRLGMHPSIEAVDLAYHPGSPAHEGALRVTRQLVDNGLRWDGPRERLTEIRDTGAVGSTWTLTAVSTSLEATLVDTSGIPTPEQPATLPSQRFVIQLVEEEGRWRYYDVQPLGDPLG